MYIMPKTANKALWNSKTLILAKNKFVCTKNKQPQKTIPLNKFFDNYMVLVYMLGSVAPASGAASDSGDLGGTGAASAPSSLLSSPSASQRGARAMANRKPHTRMDMENLSPICFRICWECFWISEDYDLQNSPTIFPHLPLSPYQNKNIKSSRYRSYTVTRTCAWHRRSLRQIDSIGLVFWLFLWHECTCIYTLDSVHFIQQSNLTSVVCFLCYCTTSSEATSV